MESSTRRSLRFVLGLATLVVLALGAWRIFRVLEAGPDPAREVYTVLLKDAGGLRPGSALRFRGMEVGEVKRLGLDLESGRVRVQVSVPVDLVGIFSTTTQCWVVKPRFGGIAGGLSGLDTLIKDGYLRIRTRPGGKRLAPGEELFGLEAPPEDLAEGELEDPHRGDLLARVLLPDAHGLSVGSPVQLRGIEVGEVRWMRLSEKGEGVVVSLRVARAFRKTVREKSRFWVARPTVHGSLLTGITADRLWSLLRPALAYDQGEKESGPATDGAFFIGLALPSSAQEDWPGRLADMEALVAGPQERGRDRPSISPKVKVRYSATEKDTFSDDAIKTEGDGLLFGRGDRFFVLVARSACDASFILTDSFWDRLEIADEKIRVHIEDGRVWPARRIWVAPQELDLTILECSPPKALGSVALPPWHSYLDFGRGVQVSAAGKPAGKPASKSGGASAGEATEKPERLRPGLLLEEKGLAFAVWGRPKAGSGGENRMAPFSLVPKLLRPQSP